MKTNNTYSRFSKLTAVVLLALIMLFSLCGCDVLASKEIKEFWKAENGYNADAQNVVEKYGGLCVSTSIEYADGSTQHYDTCVSKDGVVVSEEEGWYRIRYEDEWYRYYIDGNGNSRYEKYAVFDEDYSLDSEYANPGFIFCEKEKPGFITLVDKGTTLVTNKDGSYTWTSSSDFDNGTEQGTALSTVQLNADYEITEKECTYYLEDDSVLMTIKEKFSTGTQNEELISALAEALKKANGQTNHVTFNAVKDGKIVETYETDVPKGFCCRDIFPMKYCDEDGNIEYFSDIELTQKYNIADPYDGDVVVYFNADVEK